MRIYGPGYAARLPVESERHGRGNGDDMDGHDTAFLITGVTGFLGRRVLRNLLNEQLPVIALIRGGRVGGTQRPGAQARASDLLETLGCSGHASRLTVIDADIANLAVDRLCEQISLAMQQIGARRLMVVNVAASLKMDFDGQARERREATRKLNQRTNVEGLENLIRTFDRLDERSTDGAPVVSSIVHFSTCYAHGRRTGAIEECALDEDARAENSYEASKRDGEIRLARWQQTRRQRIPVTVIRPSIVTGEGTRDGFLAWLNILGETVALDGLPGWVRWVLGITESSARLIDVGGRAVRRLHVPCLPLLGNPRGVLDLIDVDDVERYSWKVIQQHRAGVVAPEVRYLHLSNPDAPTLRQVTDMTLAAFGHPELAPRVKIIRGFWLFAGLLQIFSAIPVAGRMIRGLYLRTSMLRPYMMRSTGTRFETTRTAAYFEAIGMPYRLRAVDTDYIRTLLRQAASGDGGHPQDDDAEAAPPASAPPSRECAPDALAA
jgi:nucleoside-diphosphate-sugar epimerase